MRGDKVFLKVKRVGMSFIFGKGEQLREKLQDFPLPWVNWLLAAKILVIGVMDDKIVGAFGVRSVFNMTTAYVKEQHRGHGIGGQLFDRAIYAARKHGIHFLTGEARSDNKTSLHLCFNSGSKVVKHLPKRGSILIIWPLSPLGEVAYIFSKIVCSMVPSYFLGQIVQLISEKTAPGVIEE